VSGEYDGSEPIKSLGGDLIPQAWDPTLNGGDGGWRVVEPTDLAEGPPLAALSGNIPDTTVPTGSAVALPAGACARGLTLQALITNTDAVRWGAAGVGTTSGGWLWPGDSAFVPVGDSAAVSVISATAGQVLAGVRF
jgi:hypothetical protein